MEKKNYAFCDSCTNKSFSNKEGTICKLTQKKPDFIESCKDFEFNRENHLYSYNSVVKNSILVLKKQRIINCLIDSISLVFINFYLAKIIVSVDNINSSVIVGFNIIILTLYYSLMELYLGQTLGKMITKTIVVDSLTLKKPSNKQIFIRSISRLPIINIFDALSFLIGINFHDKVSNTILVKHDKNLISQAHILIDLKEKFSPKTPLD
jgi:hypothetical protein